MSVFKRFQGKRIKPNDKNYKNGRWYVWKRISGKIIHKAIPEAQTKEQAEQAERRIIDDAFNRKYGVKSVIQFQTFANGIYRRYCDQHNVNIGAKRLYIERLVGRFGSSPINEITPQDCRDCQEYFRNRTSASSTNRIMSTASKLFTLACEEGILDRNPMQYVKSLKEPPRRNRLLTEEEKERLWKELENDTLLLRLVNLAINLPLRRGQLVAISPAAVDLQNGLLFTIESKGRPPRVVPLNFTALTTLRQMIDEGQLPFPLKDFRKRWSRALIETGINKKGGTREENFHFHDLRKEFTWRLRKDGVDSKTIQHLFAHSDQRITDAYIIEDFELMKQAVNRLDVQEIGGEQ